MQLTLDSLEKAGAFAGGLEKREITWASKGKEHKFEVYVRPMSYHTAVNDIAAIRDGGDIVAARLAGGICDSDGKSVFTVADITGLNDDGTPVMIERNGKLVERGGIARDLANELMTVLGEVSGLGKSQS